MCIPTLAAAQDIDRRIDVELSIDGLAFVQERLRLRGEAGTEAEFREPIPERAGLASLRVCRRDRCVRGSTAQRRGDPSAPHAMATQAAGEITIVAGPLDPRAPLI